MRKVLLLALCASGLNLAAQSVPSAAAPPASVPVALPAPSSPATADPSDAALTERPATHVILVLDATRTFSVDLPASPIIHGDEINLIPGEEFLVEVEAVKGRLVHPRRVFTVEHPERTLRLKFSQGLRRADPGMIFTISNPFKQALRYRSRIVPAGSTDFQETRNVGVGPEMTSYEAWPGPIIRLLLSDFELAAPDAPRYTPGEKK